MMQVIHTYHGAYPFGLKKESQNTTMQLIKQVLNEEEISLFRQMTKIHKSISNPHFMKLIKMLREDSTLHFIYEYHEISLENYIEELGKNMQGSFTKEKYKELLIQFKANIDSIIDHLIKNQIKTDVFISNMAYSSSSSKQTELFIKVFIDMDAQYLSLIDHTYRAKESKKKDRSALNQQFLTQFYQAERKRLMINFEDLLEKSFGKLQDEKKQFPNFCIKGTKLVFLNPDQKSKDNSSEIKQKSIKSNESKDKITHQNSSQTLNYDRNSLNVLEEKKSQDQKQKKAPSNTPIVNFDESFEPEFKPEQFLKEKTYIYEQNDYLQSLQEQLTKMKTNPEKKKEQPQQKQQKTEPQKQKPEYKKLIQPNEKVKQIKPIDLTISQGSTQSNPNNMSHNRSKDNENSSHNDSTDKKEGKLNKYKMKIITSHQIEIEGGEEPNVDQIEKQIIQGIRNGKISINDLANNHQKITVTTKGQSHDSGRKDSISPELCKSDHKDQSRDSSDDREKMSSSEDIRKNNQSNKESSSMVKTKQIPIHKMATVNEIIQRLGLKQKLQNSKEQEGSDHTKKNIHSYLQTSNTPVHKQEKHELDLTEQIEKPEKKLQLEKAQPSESVQEKAEKTEKAENYLNKIREAKTKAEQLLKEYAKKKQ